MVLLGLGFPWKREGEKDVAWRCEDSPVHTTTSGAPAKMLPGPGGIEHSYSGSCNLKVELPQFTVWSCSELKLMRQEADENSTFSLTTFTWAYKHNSRSWLSTYSLHSPRPCYLQDSLLKSESTYLVRFGREVLPFTWQSACQVGPGRGLHWEIKASKALALREWGKEQNCLLSVLCLAILSN